MGTTATGAGASTIQSRILGASKILSDMGSGDQSQRTEDDHASTKQISELTTDGSSSGTQTGDKVLHNSAVSLSQKERMRGTCDLIVILANEPGGCCGVLHELMISPYY